MSGRTCARLREPHLGSIRTQPSSSAAEKSPLGRSVGRVGVRRDTVDVDGEIVSKGGRPKGTYRGAKVGAL